LRTLSAAKAKHSAQHKKQFYPQQAQRLPILQPQQQHRKKQLSATHRKQLHKKPKNF
jgi:hypothetical protein